LINNNNNINNNNCLPITPFAVQRNFPRKQRRLQVGFITRENVETSGETKSTGKSFNFLIDFLILYANLPLFGRRRGCGGEGLFL
jgi:hypothetical protein